MILMSCDVSVVLEGEGVSASLIKRLLANTDFVCELKTSSEFSLKIQIHNDHSRLLRVVKMKF